MRHLPVLLPLTFLLGALIIPLLGNKRLSLAHAFAVGTAALATVLASLGLRTVITEGTIRYRLGGWMPPIGIELVLDPLSAFVVVVICGVAALVLLHARRTVLEELPRKSVPFYSLTLVLLTGLTGMVVTGDLFNLYVFLEISSLATYALVALGEKRAPVAAFRYLILGSVGAAFYLLGLGFLLLRTGSLNMADVKLILHEVPANSAVTVGVILMVVGVGLKMALFPLHGWLPDAYSYASSAATALIAPIGTKVAAYVLIRLLLEVLVTPVQTLALGRVIEYLGAAGILWGSWLALKQTDLKRMLAWSSVGQVGYIAAGIGLGSSLGLTAAVLHILNHACMKGCLFLVSANFRHQLGHTDLNRLQPSVRRRLPWTCAALVVAALSMIGLPPTAGFFSKWYLILGAVEKQHGILVAIIVLSSLLNAIYFFRVIERLYLRPENPDLAPEDSKAEEVPSLMLSPTLVLSGALLVLGLGNAPHCDPSDPTHDPAGALNQVEQTYPSFIPFYALLASAAAVPLILLSKRHPNVREAWTLLAAVIKFALVLSLLPGLQAGRVAVCSLVTLSPGIGLSFRADALGVFFAAVASGLWIVTSIYSIGYMRGHGEKNQTRYFACFALSLAATIGVAFAANLLTFTIFYELLTLATYPLVAHAQTPAAIRAGRQYLAYSLSGGLVLTAASAWVFLATGSMDFQAGGIPQLRTADGVRMLFCLFLAGVGVKSALMPLHSWLPNAMVAPAPVSALLHAVAVVKSGVFGIIRVVGFIFGPETMSSHGLRLILGVTAGLTVLLASLLALREDELKRRLAYSTISHLSYVVLGVALLSPFGLSGAIFHIATHALMKITLFFCAGALYVHLHLDRVSQLNGVGRTMPWTMGAFTLGALGLAGVPPIGGFLSKWYLCAGAIQGGSVTALVLLLFSGLLNAAYFFPIIHRAFLRPSSNFTKPREASGFLVVPLCCTAFIALVMGLYPHLFLFDLAAQTAAAVLQPNLPLAFQPVLPAP